MILGLHHVQITIPKDTEEMARAFYCDVLGLVEKEKPESLQGRGGFWLSVGHQEVHVGTEDGVERLNTKAHIAYLVEDIEYWERYLKKQEVEILDSIPIPGYKRFEFRDPFGNRVEMIQMINSHID